MSRMPIVYSSRSRIEELSRNLYRIDLPMPEAIGPTNSYLFKADGITDTTAHLSRIRPIGISLKSFQFDACNDR